jgi:hypothetical protein
MGCSTKKRILSLNHDYRPKFAKLTVLSNPLHIVIVIPCINRRPKKAFAARIALGIGSMGNIGTVILS